MHAKTAVSLRYLVVVVTCVLFYYCLKILCSHITLIHCCCSLVSLAFVAMKLDILSPHACPMVGGNNFSQQGTRYYVFKIGSHIYTFLFQVLVYTLLSFTAVVYSSIQSTALPRVVRLPNASLNHSASFSQTKPSLAP